MNQNLLQRKRSDKSSAALYMLEEDYKVDNGKLVRNANSPTQLNSYESRIDRNQIQNEYRFMIFKVKRKAIVD